MLIHLLTTGRRAAVAAVATALVSLSAPCAPARAQQSGQKPVIAEYGQWWRYVANTHEGDVLTFGIDIRVEDVDSAKVQRRILVLDRHGEVFDDWNVDTALPEDNAWMLRSGTYTDFNVREDVSFTDVIGATIIMTAVDAEGNEADPITLKVGRPPTEPGDPVVRTTEVDISVPKVIVSGVGFSKRSRVQINGVTADPSVVTLSANKKTLTIGGDLSIYGLGAGGTNEIKVTKGPRRSTPHYLKH